MEGAGFAESPGFLQAALLDDSPTHGTSRPAFRVDRHLRTGLPGHGPGRLRDSGQDTGNALFDPGVKSLKPHGNPPSFAWDDASRSISLPEESGRP